MKNITAYLSPEKYRAPVLAPTGNPKDFDYKAVDCPFVFEHGGEFKMLYIGFNGDGYQTGLARSSHPGEPFTREALLLKAGEGNGWDTLNAAGNWILCENNLWEPRRLKKVDGKYWMVYHSYPGVGYEVGPGRLGLAYCEDDSLKNWTRLPEPILQPEEGEPWEQGGLYKACLLEQDGTFYIFYNAKNSAARWVEQTGMIYSKDLKHWERYEHNPILPIGGEGSWNSAFSSDPCVFYDEIASQWVMYFFGYDYHHAQEGIAFSKDLHHWHAYPKPILKAGSPGSLDETHAHKPSVLVHNGALYHYYCACRPPQAGDPDVGDYQEHRCITYAKGTLD